MNRTSPLAVALAAFLIVPASASAQCKLVQEPSIESTAAAAIDFFNRTGYPMRVFWSGLDGRLKPFGDWIKPGGHVRHDTFVGHRWFVEVKLKDYRECSFPISAPQPESCEIRIVHNGGIGYDPGTCDFDPAYYGGE
jgi:hypothetical protein